MQGKYCLLLPGYLSMSTGKHFPRGTPVVGGRSVGWRGRRAPVSRAAASGREHTLLDAGRLATSQAPPTDPDEPPLGESLLQPIMK